MMSGMLVPVDDLYEPVDKSMQAIHTLFGIDPEFVTLCKTLYGPDVDPVEVWGDVFKMEPTGSDSHVPGTMDNGRNRKRALDAAGIGATVIGLGLGGKEGKASIREIKTARRLGTGSLWPKAKLAGISAMGAGDAIATGNQISSARQKRRAVRGTKAARYSDVEKVGLGALAAGFETGMRKLPGMGGLAPKVKTGMGSLVPKARSAMSAQPRATLAGGATTTGAIGLAAGMHRQKVKDQRSGMIKRDDSDDLDVVWAGEFSKFDEDKRLVFGWASVVELNGTPVVDRQGDYIHPDDLENASYEYVIKSRVGGDMHSRDGEIPLKVSDLVESMVFTPEKIAKMGLPDAVKDRIPTGWWVGFKVHSDKHWDLVKKNARTGFSIHGRGKRVPTSMDELMPGYH